ncbi:PII uridylyltransferase [Gordonia effusa NBRC 100432]|uniref:Bifunctional uridylyltransferase/uridylyl-removing enzyme n=1 Tax=Gordonia effusa NBRC 100432 TaxID=1077974 RepID=H0QZ19_9ACTN|nr:[protein-PII] uridylyltransferase [Gordonia effusa]GAB18070.1 PII uridylyltransferase [Gordonia effusa NBRC 100432]
MTTSPIGSAKDLTIARRNLLERNASGKLDAPGVRRALGDLYEFWLAAKATELGITERSGFAIVAVGGLGRREVVPYSDLDLILLHDDMNPDRVAEVADGLWYPLWDANIGLDHSVRTVPQALAVAREDVSAALGMTEARHIVGDEDLSSLLIGGTRQQWRTEIRRRLPEVIAHAQGRWQRAGDIAHRTEPDLKNGRGGLRDVQLLSALALGQLTDGMGSLRADSPGAAPQLAYARLLDIRTELHRIAGRAREQVRAQDADEIGAALRVGDRFDLSRVISDASRTITYSLEVGIRTASNAVPRRSLAALRRTPIRRPLDEGVVEHHGEIVLARNAIPSRDPGLVLRVASASARTGLPIRASTLGRLADFAPELRAPWSAEAREDLLGLLSTGHRILGPIEALDRTGLWGRLLPEWGAVRDLPPRDAIHTWTVDRHLVETVAYAATMTTRVSRPDLLLLGALIHDLGKGREADHSVVGAELAVAIGQRMGLWPQDTETLAAIVRHHLLLPQIATRRDLADPATAAEVAYKLGHDRQLLELLSVLAEADSRATGPGVWGDWKASLIAELVRRTGALIEGETSMEPAELTAEQRHLAETGGFAVTLVQAPDGPHTYLVTMVAPDGLGLLSRMAGVLALSGLRVLAATIAGHAGSAINTFRVVPRFGEPPQDVVLRQQLISAVQGKTDVAARLAERAAAEEASRAGVDKTEGLPALFGVAPSRVTWSEPHSDVVVMELRAADAVGLLCKVTAIIERRGGEVVWAKAITLGGTVVDTFGLRLTGGADAAKERIEKDVIAATTPLSVPSAPDQETTERH